VTKCFYLLSFECQIKPSTESKGEILKFVYALSDASKCNRLKDRLFRKSKKTKAIQYNRDTVAQSTAIKLKSILAMT